ncbi:MAG TPA: kelch repeat-containing protein [Pyrinomonadaceae bacterium]|nr:kelch repeat-containing protein [Pyrinomonadaceae bacterium]
MIFSSAFIFAIFAGLTLIPHSVSHAQVASRAAQTPIGREESSAADSSGKPDLLWMKGAHAGGIGHAAVSPDGQILATADYAEIDLWRYADGQLLGTLGMAGVDRIGAIKFSPDGQYLIAGGTQSYGYPGPPSTLRAWRVSDRSLVRQFNLAHSVISIDISADGQTIVATHGYTSVVTLNFNTGEVLRTLEPFAAKAVAISPDGSTIAATGADNFGDVPSVNIWRASDGTLVNKLFGLSFISDSIAFSPNGLYLAAGDWGGGGAHGKVMVWLIPGFVPVQALTTQYTGSIYSLGFSQDSQYIAAGGTDDAIWLWHLPDGILVQSIEADIYAAIWTIIFSNDNTLFASGAQHISYVWHVPDGTFLRSIGGGREFVTSSAFSPDGKYFATDNAHFDDGPWSVEMFEAATGNGVRGFAQHNDIINSVAFSPDGQLLASASGSQPPDTRDTRIFVSRVSNGTAQLILPGHSGGTLCVAFSPDGQLLASSGRDNLAALWRVSDGAVVNVFRGHGNWVQALAFSPDGQILATGSGDSTVKLWRVSDGLLIRTIPGNAYPIGSLAFAPDGQSLALTAFDSVQVWRVSDGTLLQSMKGQPGVFLGQIAYSADGQVLLSASGSYAPTVWFWRVSDGALLQTYTQETGWMQPPSLAVSPDGTRLGIGRYDAIVEMARFPALSGSGAGPNYEGSDDATDCNFISGWAWDSHQPNAVINVDIYDGSSLLATIPANAFRQDLLDTGKGNGSHAFNYAIPARLKDGRAHSLGVKFAGTNTDLFKSPRSLTCGTPPPAPLPGSWSGKPSMPTARQSFAVAVGDGKLYAVGGDGNNGDRYNGVGINPLNVLEAYDPVNNNWSTLAPMPTPRIGPVAGFINGQLYVVGGFNTGYLNTLQAYNPATNNWTTLAPMPTARYNMAAGVINGKLYVVGGYDPGVGYSSALEVYDPATNNWSRLAPLPTARYRLAAGVIGGKLYAVAGSPWNWANNTSSLQVYDPATNSWSILADMPMALDSLAAGVIGGRLYTVGGSGPTKAVNVYDPATNSWTTSTPMPTARRLLCAGVIGDQLYALGGVDSDKVVLKTMDMLAVPLCSISLNPSSDGFAGEGGDGTITITNPSGCAMNVTSQSDWIIINSIGGSNNGVSTVNFSVAPNSLSFRTGTINIAGIPFTVEEKGGYLPPPPRIDPPPQQGGDDSP